MEEQLSLYGAWMAAALLLSFGLFGARGLKERGRWSLAALSLCFGALLGLLCAKVAYYLCQLDFMMAQGWQEMLFRLDPDGLSFYGGVAGVCLGVALAARLRGRKPMEVLNSFTSFGLILAALARFGETFLGMLGVGPYLEDEALCFFPLAKGFSYGDDWTEWYLAVFVLEGVSLLAVAAMSAARFRSHRFLRGVFWMCLPQILLENLRLSSFMWFFCIRVEQLACMVAMFVILVLYGVRGRGRPRRFLPAGIALLCAGLFIVCEFAMEGKIIFLQFLTQEACYALMFLGLVILGITEIRAYRRLVRPAET